MTETTEGKWECLDREKRKLEIPTITDELVPIHQSADTLRILYFRCRKGLPGK